MTNFKTFNSKDYPLDVEYCGYCGLPPDLCIYFQNYGSCLEWLKNQHPDEFEKLMEENLEKLKFQQTSSTINLKVREEFKFGTVGISMNLDENRKNLTSITGLSGFRIDIKGASEYLKEFFHCGVSVKGPDEIVLEGNFKKQLYTLLPEKWKIDSFNIEDLDDPDLI